MVTVAPLITAPVGSVTVPEIVPEVTWASAVDAMSVIAKSNVLLTSRTALLRDGRFMT